MQHGSTQLQGWLTRRALNQREAAKTLRLHYTTLNKILKGIRPPGREVAIRIEEQTGIPVAAWSTAVGKRGKSQRRQAKKSQHWQGSNAHVG